MTHATIELLKAWFIFSFSLGCWTCLNLLVSKRGDRKVKRSILAFIVLLLVPPLNAYITLVNEEPLHWLATLSQKLTWCYGPIMVALVQYILLRPVSRFGYVIQAAPFCFFLIHDIFQFHLVTFAQMLSLLVLHVFCYLFYAAYLLKSQRTRLLKITKEFKNSTYYWLIYLITSLAVIMIFDLTIFTSILFEHSPSFTALAAIASLIAIVVNTIALFSIYQPSVFFHDLRAEDEPSTSEKIHLRSIELSAEAARQLDEQLEDLVKIHKPHLDESISLSKLAYLLGVTSHQLSELLNIHKSVSFYDFLNNLRYQESLQLLVSNKDELTISDIAYRSGFNNRNTFYKVFKEKTGVTPSEYKKASR